MSEKSNSWNSVCKPLKNSSNGCGSLEKLTKIKPWSVTWVLMAGPLLLSDDWVGSVSANVVEGLDGPVLGLDQEELDTHDVVGKVVTGLLEGGGVSSVQPGLHEDGTLFQLEDLLGEPP
ncbi:hypothetical protein WICPIJ_008012 [Wickerhamomyces pijperi]|uniref:Uncharacterized protein n=1 Tax=Wickerhamomyces pijperi TaxID=599730 RepID=A0A9P8TJE2_WICPI|nr:hypothetical protein WICPIJ_008012 [Wickerhamomyces pijperi]